MATIDGLSSGLDTTSIINSLMQLERIPQQRLQTKQAAVESSLASLRTLATKFLSTMTAAEKLGASLPGAPVANPPKPSDWQLTTATSSDKTRAAASAVTGAPAGSLTFNVAQLATAASHLSTGTWAATTDAVATDPVTGTAHTSLQLSKGGGAPVTVDTGDGSLAATVAAINKAGAGVTASAVQVQPGEYRLQLSSTTTGAASTVSLTTPDGTPVGLSDVVTGRDAQIVLGGVTITRPSNTMTDLLEGVTLTLSKADAKDANGAFVDPPVTVTVKRDDEGVASRVQALVDAVNAARGEAKSLTALDPVTKAKGRLYGDSTTRGLVDLVRTTVSQGTAEQSAVGVTVSRDGTVVLDKAKLLAALAADPAAVEAALGKDGLAGRLHALSDTASRVETAVGGAGLITSAIKGRESQIASLKTNIASWDSRLSLKQITLERQYTALETALGKAKSQGQWLSGQLANLPTYGG